VLKKRLSKSLYSERWEQLLEIMKRTRKEYGLTQSQLATRLGRPQSLIAKIESGERKLDVCQFLDYVEAIGTDPVILIQELKSMPLS
jgi:transcriptional regulator with XRE-family HTH domain